jgi:hypothetical protein
MITSYTLLRDESHRADVAELCAAMEFATESDLYRFVIRERANALRAAKAAQLAFEPDDENPFEDEAPDLDLIDEALQEELPQEEPDDEEDGEELPSDEETPEPYTPEELPDDTDSIELASIEREAETEEHTAGYDWRPLIARAMVALVRLAPPGEAQRLAGRIPKAADKPAVVALLVSHCRKHLRERRFLN